MIIVECCTNWDGLGMAQEMIKVASEVAPGNLVKFQLFDAEDDKGKPHYEWVKAHELTFDQAKMLFDYGASIGQKVLFSVFGVKFVDWCERIGVKRYKLASGMIANSPLFEAVRKTGKPLLLSSEQWGLSSAFELVRFLYCPPGYPQQKFAMPIFNSASEYDSEAIGFSDHATGIDAAKIAFARGAEIVEEHFCLEHNPRFPDDAWSRTPDDLRELVRWEKVCKEML